MAQSIVPGRDFFIVSGTVKASRAPASSRSSRAKAMQAASMLAADWSQ